MAALIERVGIAVRVYRKRRAGTIVYEDDFQVSAVPWRTDVREVTALRPQVPSPASASPGNVRVIAVATASDLEQQILVRAPV